MMKRERDIRKPKTGFRLFVARCSVCGNNSLVELRKQQKTVKHNCSKCLIQNRHKITGKIKKIYQVRNVMKIKWF